MRQFKDLKRLARRRSLHLRALPQRLLPRGAPVEGRQIFLHVGPHKTGTTTAQASFRANRRALAPYLHILPRLDPDLDALCRLTREARNIAKAEAALPKIAQVATRLGAAQAHHPRLLISQEDLMGNRPTMKGTKGLYRPAPLVLGCIVEALEAGGAQVTVLFTLRPFDAWVASLQRDLAARQPHHRGKSPEDYAEAVKFPEAGWPHLLSRLRPVLGDRLVTLEMAEDVATQRMGESLLRAAGVAPEVLDGLRWAAPRRVTRPLSSPTDSG